MSLTPDKLPARYRPYELRFEQVVAFAQALSIVPTDALRVQLQPLKGTATRLAAWTAPWPDSKTLRASADMAGRPGEWQLTVGIERLKATEVLEDIVLCFVLRARR